MYAVERNFSLDAIAYVEGIACLDELHVGMTLPSIVTNVTAFGAFINISAHGDSQVQNSHLADTFVRTPHDGVQVQQIVVTITNRSSTLRILTCVRDENPVHFRSRKTASSSS